MTSTTIEAVAETTETTATDSLEVIISSAMNSSEETSDKAGIIVSAIADKFIDFLPTLGIAVLVFIVGILITKFILHIFKKFTRRANVDSAAEGFLVSVIKIVLYILIIIISLSIMDIPMTSLIAVLSAAGLAVGLALQNSLSNLAGGFIILFSKPFKSGDTIDTGTAVGKVERIDILYTKILTADNKSVYIPNGTVAGSQIINYSEQDKRRVDLEFGISYDDDVETAKNIILKIAKKHQLVLDDPEPPFARLGLQAEDSLQITVRVWTMNEDYWQVKFDITEAVNDAFIKHNITVPFRQLDVHIQKD